jgi:dihydroorotase
MFCLFFFLAEQTTGDEIRRAKASGYASTLARFITNPPDALNGLTTPQADRVSLDESNSNESLCSSLSFHRHVYGVKLYPSGATTNSASGVTSVEKVTEAIGAMQEVNVTDRLMTTTRSTILLRSVVAPITPQQKKRTT